MQIKRLITESAHGFHASAICDSTLGIKKKRQDIQILLNLKSKRTVRLANLQNNSLRSASKKDSNYQQQILQHALRRFLRRIMPLTMLQPPLVIFERKEL